MKLQILSDLRQGIIRYYYKYIIIFFVACTIAIQFFLKTNIYIKKYNIADETSVIDCFIYMFKGMKEYIPSTSNPFNVPFDFLLFNLILGLLIGYYPHKDLHGMGLQMMIKSKQRIFWWSSKCIWNMATVISYYAAIYMGILIAGMLFKTQITGEIHKELIHRMLGMEIVGYKQFEIIIFVGLLPIISSIAISMFQMFLSFLVHPIVSYIIIIILYIFSAFYMKWFLPGNFLMFYRNYIVNPNGIHIFPSMMVNMIIILISFIVGYFYFRNVDILGKE
ncbi:hypothetical protein [[Clostridium] fimetarium]|uniref:ABC-2 family transporter protein n=1 Tax=[Clostridium] fimetarium TaxID=99656 RepID=A0A1I0RP59_9FIRM|nr:hypothetical protein [[Clostridium] fimetarium]SEW43032.1 hypothetical protein SAMN05421659_12018 [[Clostridium] fimetarium]